jgi:hypothetical protein
MRRPERWVQSTRAGRYSQAGHARKLLSRQEEFWAREELTGERRQTTFSRNSRKWLRHGRRPPREVATSQVGVNQTLGRRRGELKSAHPEVLLSVDSRGSGSPFAGAAATRVLAPDVVAGNAYVVTSCWRGL